jgi:hypothetical protein
MTTQDDITHLHWLKVPSASSDSKAKLKLIYIPGMSGTAEDGAELLNDFDNIDGVAMSLRGRGQSTAPNGKFGFKSHFSDVFEFLKVHGTEAYFLHCYSVSTAFAISALAQKGCPRPQGLVIGDYPARYSKLHPGWANWFSTLSVAGRPTLSAMTMETMIAIERDSEDVDLSGCLGDFDFPVLILKANGTTPGPSPMTAQDLEIYRTKLKKCKVMEFDSDHFFRDRERAKYVQTIQDFICLISLLECN